MSDIPYTPEVRRQFNCPALQICEELGTAKNGCRANSRIGFSPGNCQASTVMLLDQLLRQTNSQPGQCAGKADIVTP